MKKANENADKALLAFLREETLQGRLEVTVPEISRGLNISYVDGIRLVERLETSGVLTVRERGTAKRATHFFALVEIVEMCKEAWLKAGLMSTITKRVDGNIVSGKVKENVFER